MKAEKAIKKTTKFIREAGLIAGGDPRTKWEIVMWVPNPGIGPRVAEVDASIREGDSLTGASSMRCDTQSADVILSTETLIVDLMTDDPYLEDSYYRLAHALWPEHAEKICKALVPTEESDER